jgi:hypothetical protein
MVSVPSLMRVLLGDTCPGTLSEVDWLSLLASLAQEGSLGTLRDFLLNFVPVNAKLAATAPLDRSQVANINAVAQHSSVRREVVSLWLLALE